MQTITKFLALFITAAFFVGCGGGAPKPEAQLPKWYLNPQLSDASTYYAVGEGATKDEAKLNALNAIAGEISTTVSSNMESNAQSHTTNSGESVTKDVKLNIKSSVDKIKFTSAKVIENAFANGKFYSYVSVDRGLLFNALKKTLDANFNKATSLWEHMQSAGIFEVFKKGKELKNIITKTMPSIAITKAVNPNFDDSNYIQTLEAISNNLRSAKTQAVVYVHSINADTFADVLKKYISSFNMNLISSPSQAHDRSKLMVVEISYSAKPKKVKTTDPRLRGASFADVKIKIKTKDANGKIVAENLIRVINISKEGYQNAVVKTAKFERELKKKGLMNILLENSAK